MFVCGWGAFFTEAAFFAEAFLRTGPFGMVFFAATAAVALRASFFAALLDFAQRAFCAAEIFARAASLKVRTGLLLLRLALAEVGGLFRLPTLVPAKSARACCSREISASISRTILFVSMIPSAIEDNPRIESPFCVDSWRDLGSDSCAANGREHEFQVGHCSRIVTTYN